MKIFLNLRNKYKTFEKIVTSPAILFLLIATIIFCGILFFMYWNPIFILIIILCIIAFLFLLYLSIDIKGRISIEHNYHILEYMKSKKFNQNLDSIQIFENIIIKKDKKKERYIFGYEIMSKDIYSMSKTEQAEHRKKFKNFLDNLPKSTSYLKVKKDSYTIEDVDFEFSIYNYYLVFSTSVEKLIPEIKSTIGALEFKAEKIDIKKLIRILQ
jgi:hypothetical protein